MVSQNYAKVHGVKRTRRNQVVRLVREHYLREDIDNPLRLAHFHGSEQKESAGKPKEEVYVTLDASCLPYQVDVLERGAEEGAITGVMIYSSVVEAVRRLRGESAKRRVLDLFEGSPGRLSIFQDDHHAQASVASIPPVKGERREERDRRGFARACKWLVESANGGGESSAMEVDGSQSAPTSCVLVAVSDDITVRDYLNSSGELKDLVAAGLIRIKSTEEWISKAHPHLLDLVALSSSAAGEEEAGGAMPTSTSTSSFLPYPHHLSIEDAERKIKQGLCFKGKIKCTSRYSPWTAMVDIKTQDSGSSDLTQVKVLGRSSLNRAMDGDLVCVELVDTPTKGSGDPKDTSSLEKSENFDVGLATVAENDAEGEDEVSASVQHARVVCILRRAWRDKGYTGSIQPRSLPQSDTLLKNPGRPIGVLFQPSDRRLPLVRLRTRQANLLKDQRIIVVVDAWERDSAYPNGHYVRALGSIGERETETKVILHQHDVADPDEGFSPAVHACVPALPWSVPTTIADTWRKDIRSMCVFSVDPPGCRDIDDALSARHLSPSDLKEDAHPEAISLAAEGRLVQLGVHIADVTHFLKPNTPMDLEASRRCTSVYLVDRRIDMLPKPLTEDICSLRSNVDRYAFSVLWLIDASNARIIGEPEFFKSVIHSKAALTYQEAQAKIDAGGSDVITTSLLLLRKITRMLRQKRVDLGALTLASPEVKFEIDRETHDPLDVGMYVTRETNKVVEEMMLLANETVATCIFEKGFARSALLRRHPVPTRTMFEPLLKACQAAHIEMDVATSKALADSLDKAGATQTQTDKYLNTLIRFMATRCMTQAEYFSSGDVAQSQFAHYGLAMPIYTHFTSPIRRYADVVVHRQLAACIGLDPPSVQLCESQLVTEQCEVLNVRHKNAQWASRASAELYTLVFFRGKPTTEEARVVKVREKGVVVFIPKYGIEGTIALAQEDWTKVENALRMVSRAGKRTLNLFDRVTVRIEVQQEGQSRQEHLVLSLVP